MFITISWLWESILALLYHYWSTDEQWTDVQFKWIIPQDQQKEPVSRQRQEGERKLTRKHDNSDQASASRTSSSAVPRPQDSKEAAQPATEKQSDVPSGGVSTSSTSVIPNMPRGVTLSNIVSDEVRCYVLLASDSHLWYVRGAAHLACVGISALCTFICIFRCA